MSVKHQNYIVAALFMIACGFITARAIAETRPVDPAHVARHYGFPRGGFSTVRLIWENPEIEVHSTVHHFRRAATMEELFCECRGGTGVIFVVENDGDQVFGGTCLSDQDNLWDTSDFDTDFTTFAAGADLDIATTLVVGGVVDCSIFAYF